LVWPCGTRWFAQRRHLPHAIGNPAQPTRSALAEQLIDLTT
jgi:hypothetical protein